MGRMFGFLVLVVGVAIGLFLFLRTGQTLTPGGTSPRTMIDVTGVQNDLIAIAKAERRYWATNGKYASLDELRTNGDISVPTRPGYTYSADVSDSGFKIIATYAGADPKAPKHISIDGTMAVTTY